MLVMTAFPASAAMTLEDSETWEGDGDTIVHGVYVGNVDDSVGPEIVTAGETVSVSGASSPVVAELKVWTHDGSALTLKDSALWRSQSNMENVWLGVHAADVDRDGTKDIVTVGYTVENATPRPVVAVWSYDGRSITEEDSWSTNLNATFRSVHLKDVAGDPDLEILVAGTNNSDCGGGVVKVQGLLALFAYGNGVLNKATQTEWVRCGVGGGVEATAYSVHAEDIDDSSPVEIVTAGYIRPTVNDPKKGEVRVWTYSGSVFQLQDAETESWDEDIVFHGVFSANVDDDANNHDEMLACGILGDQGLLSIFRYASGTITYQTGITWGTGGDAGCNSVHAANLDGTTDPELEITAGGWALLQNVYNGEIHVFDWEGGGSDPINLEHYTYWHTTGNTRVDSVYNGNADADGDIEVSSGGQAHDGGNERGELRIYRLA